MSLIRISRDPDGTLELRGRAWQEDGSCSVRYWSEAVKERKEPSGVSSGVFYYWKGERPRDPNAPQLDGTGEILRSSPIARPGTSRLVAGCLRASTRGLPVFTVR